MVHLAGGSDGPDSGNHHRWGVPRHLAAGRRGDGRRRPRARRGSPAPRRDQAGSPGAPRQRRSARAIPRRSAGHGPGHPSQRLADPRVRRARGRALLRDGIRRRRERRELPAAASAEPAGHGPRPPHPRRGVPRRERDSPREHRASRHQTFKSPFGQKSPRARGRPRSGERAALGAFGRQGHRRNSGVHGAGDRAPERGPRGARQSRGRVLARLRGVRAVHRQAPRSKRRRCWR